MLALFVLRSCWGRRWVLQESTLYNLPVKPRWSPSAWDQRARLSLKSHLAVERPSAGRWTVFTEVKHRKTSRFQFCQPSFCLPVFFKHSLFPPHPTPPSASCSSYRLSGHTWRHQRAFVFPVCAFVTAANQPRQRGPRGIDMRYRRRCSHAGRWRNNEWGMKRGEEGSFRHPFLVGSQVRRAVRWERADCTPVQSSWPPLYLGHAPSRRRRVCRRRVHLLQAGTRK